MRFWAKEKPFHSREWSISHLSLKHQYTVKKSADKNKDVNKEDIDWLNDKLLSLNGIYGSHYETPTHKKELRIVPFCNRLTRYLLIDTLFYWLQGFRSSCWRGNNR